MVILVFLGLGVIVGLVKPRRVGGFLMWLIFGPVLIMVAFNEGREIFAQLSPLQQLAFALLAGLGAIVILLKLTLPPRVWDTVIGSFIYDLLKAIVLTPFRIIGWLLSVIRRGGRGMGHA